MNDSAAPAPVQQPPAYYQRRHYSATDTIDLNRNEEQPKIYRRRYRMDEVLDVPVNVPCGWNPKDCL